MNVVAVLYDSENDKLLMYNQKPHLTFPKVETHYEENSFDAVKRLLCDIGEVEQDSSGVKFLYKNTAVNSETVDLSNTYEAYLIGVKSYVSDKLSAIVPGHNFICGNMRDSLVLDETLRYLGCTA